MSAKENDDDFLSKIEEYMEEQQRKKRPDYRKNVYCDNHPGVKMRLADTWASVEFGDFKVDASTNLLWYCPKPGCDRHYEPTVFGYHVNEQFRGLDDAANQPRGKHPERPFMYIAKEGEGRSYRCPFYKCDELGPIVADSVVDEEMPVSPDPLANLKSAERKRALEMHVFLLFAPASRLPIDEGSPENRDPDYSAYDASGKLPFMTPTELQQETATLAYALWEKRRCPTDTPDYDWFCAEFLLNQLLPTPKPPSKWTEFLASNPTFADAISDGLDCIVELAHGAPASSPENLIGLLTGTIAGNLYDVVFLCENDRTDGALRLLRTPYEKFLYAHFISEHPEAADDFRQFDALQSYTFRTELAKFHKIPISDEVQAALEASAKAAREKFARTKCEKCKATSERRWTKTTPQEMMEAAKVETLHGLAYRYSTLMIHPSMRGLRGEIEPIDLSSAIAAIVHQLVWRTLLLQWTIFKKTTTATGKPAEAMRKLIAVAKMGHLETI